MTERRNVSTLRGVAGDRTLLAAVALSLAWLVAYAALIAISRADDVPAFVLGVAYLVPIAAAGALAAGAAAASRRHVRWWCPARPTSPRWSSPRTRCWAWPS
jgi:hypothetical protein